MEKSLRMGKLSAIVSFLSGTIIFALYFLTSWAGLLLVGYVFIAITGPTNIVILVNLIRKTKSNKKHRLEFYKTCGLILLNIPVMLIYCWIATILFGTMRIRLTNTTQTELTSIRIIGCEPKFVEKLMPGQSKTVWVGITGDCSIRMVYLSNGQQKEEFIAGYVTSGMGQKMQYNIGGKNEMRF
ncbi:hypothetical protein [Ferruginibacter sp.]|nr:hypothetical protein [Ferruginibacter sp.]